MATTKFPTAVLRRDLDGLEKRTTALEKADIVHSKDIAHLREDVDKNTKKVDDLERVVIENAATQKLARWLLGAFGASIIAFIWSLITGQASVAFH